MNTTAILLAAGEGTRMKSSLHKVLHPICGKAMIDYPLDLVRELGVERPVVVVGHGAESVREHIGDGVDFAVQDLVKDFFVGQFDVAIGEREGVRKKPAPDSVYEVLKEFDLKKDEVIYIGDSDVDYATAKNAGVDCILVEWGFRDRAFLESLGATVFAKKPEDILDIVE